MPGRASTWATGLRHALVIAALAFPCDASAGGSIPIAGSDGKPLADQALEITILGENGRDVTIRARTDAAGNLSYESVPRERWKPGGASDAAAVRLPDDAFGRARWTAADGSGGQAPVALRGGAPAAPELVIRDWLSPFLGVPDGANGSASSLAAGRRFTFYLPDGKALPEELPAAIRADAQLFRYPAPLGGTQVSVARGADEKATWALLESLVSQGKIEDLEHDHCREFFPEGSGLGGPSVYGAGDKPWIPVADFTPAAGFRGVLTDAATGAKLSDGFALLAPLPHTPFFDPGWQPHDARGPALQRTGQDGSFAVSLGDHRGPVVTSVGYGWNATTRTRMLGAPPPEAPKAPTPPGPPPASKPPPEPPEGNVCGPDVTKYLLGAMEHLKGLYQDWSTYERFSYCSSLYGLKFDGAWEMRGFGPFDGGLWMNDTSRPVYFEGLAPGVCAKPRHPCGDTVEFLGVCLSAQIANYVLWGAQNGLCGTFVLGLATHQMRDSALGLWREGSLVGSVYYAQEAMSAVGKRWVESDAPLADKAKDAEKTVGSYGFALQAFDKVAGVQCAKVCGQHFDATPGFESRDWGFKWGWGDEDHDEGGWFSVRGSELPKW